MPEKLKFGRKILKKGVRLFPTVHTKLKRGGDREGRDEAGGQ